jgi:hypothetical protein
MIKLSAHCNITRPKLWGYPFLESIKSFMALCDEVIIVNGACGENKDDGSIEMIKALDPQGRKIKIIDHYWNDMDWSWEELGYHLNTGYNACSGDWVFKFDIDYVFHENHIDYLRAFLELCSQLAIPPKAVEVQKLNILLADRYLPKAWMPFIVNKKDYPNLCYGLEYDEGDFMCAIDKVEEKNGMPIGWSIRNRKQMIRKSTAAVWDYDFTFMDRTQVEAVRQISYFAQVRYENPMADNGKDELKTKSIALGKFRKMMLSRYSMPYVQKIEKISEHPCFIQDRIKALKLEQFGYNMFGWINEKCSYF